MQQALFAVPVPPFIDIAKARFHLSVLIVKMRSDVRAVSAARVRGEGCLDERLGLGGATNL